MTLALKQVNDNTVNTDSIMHLQAPISSQYIDEAVLIIKEEIQELCTQTSLLLDCAEEDVSEQLTVDPKLGAKVAARLKELSAAMKFARLSIVAQLTWGLCHALENILAENRPVDAMQRSAIFTTTHLLSRYVDLCVERPQKDTGLIIAPSFHKLAQARLISYRLESEMTEISFAMDERLKSQAVIEVSELGCDSQQLRRSRQMYQVALIALLRGDTSVEPLNMIQRVCEHNKRSQKAVYSLLWSDLEDLISHFKEGRLELSLQRCYALTQFDRLLRAVGKHETINLDQGDFLLLAAELELLLQLADPERLESEQRLGAFSQPLSLTEGVLHENRKKLESGVAESLRAVCTVAQERIALCQNKLSTFADIAAESKEQIEDIQLSLQTVLKAFQFNGLSYLSEKLASALSLFEEWVSSDFSGEFDELASALIAAENAAGWLGKQVSFDFSDGDAEQPFLQEAQIKLCDEIQANIALASRALTSFTESNFNNEHIANLDLSISGAASGFKMLEQPGLYELLELCADAVRERAGSQTTEIDSTIELIADSLVTADGLINEIKKARKPNGLFDQLVKENIELLKQKMEA